MEIERVHLTRPWHTNSHGHRDEYNGTEFVFVIEDGFVACSRKTDGATVAYPREWCVLTLTRRDPAKLTPKLAEKKPGQKNAG
jgi:hypothetical protein